MKQEFVYRNVCLNVMYAEGAELQVFRRWSPKLQKCLQVRVLVDGVIVSIVSVSCGEMDKLHFFGWARAQGFEEGQIVGDAWPKELKQWNW